MTALKLDTRMPVIVMVGDFNPAIFSTLWIAKNLHGYVEGDVIEGAEAFMEIGPGALARLQFMNGVAIGVSNNRLDAYVIDHEPACLDALSRVLANIVDVLPHTPLRGLGCNLQFIEEDPSDAMLALFETPEGVEGEYIVRNRSFAAQLEADDAVLNFTRAYSDGPVQFNFNYHRALVDPAHYASVVPGLVERTRDHAVGVLRSLYGIDQYELTGFTPADVENDDGKNARDGTIVEAHDD